MDKKERNYPFAVLYPVVVMLTFRQEEFLVDLDSSIKTKSEPEVVVTTTLANGTPVH